MRALQAAVQIIELYSYDRSSNVLHAFREVVLEMQPSVRYLAFHSIAHVMDWSDRWTIWRGVGLVDVPVGKCKFE